MGAEVWVQESEKGSEFTSSFHPLLPTFPLWAITKLFEIQYTTITLINNVITSRSDGLPTSVSGGRRVQPVQTIRRTPVIPIFLPVSMRHGHLRQRR